MCSSGITRFAASLMFSVTALGTITALPAAAQTVRSAAGANPAAIQASVDQFRTDLGGVNNGVGGTFATGRREINWDAVPDSFSAPNNLPANFFNSNSPRGALFATPGTGFQVSADSSNPTSTPVEFGNINPQYANIFQTFSAERLFTALNSNITDVTFFLPGTNTPAFVKGFGSVFTDVDANNTTSIQLFDTSNNSLGTFFASSANTGLSFIGVSFTDSTQIGRVRITSGNIAPGASTDDGFFDPNIFNDVAVMDDFIYSEPQAINAVSTAAPEPATLGFLLLGGTVGVWRRVRRARKA